MSYIRSSVLRCGKVHAAAFVIILAGTLCGCGGGGGGGGGGGVQSYTIGGTVSGLAGSGLVLAINGGSGLSVAANATTFTFPAPLQSGASYAVTVSTQPSSPTQACTVSSGSGTVSGSNVTSVSIVCKTSSFQVSGIISGLTGSGLVLQDNGGDNLAVAANATGFTFPTPVLSGAPYAVTVLSQPSGPAQACTVSSGSGNVSAANVTQVKIDCKSISFQVGGSISGLTGSGLVLQDNGGDNLAIAANATSFAFAKALPPGAMYAVSVSTQPSSPAQTCTVSNATGTVSTANITNIIVVCQVSAFKVGGSISGLTAGGLVLQDNGGDNLAVAATATSFSFATPVPVGAGYAVTIATQPTAPAQVCTVSNGTGKVGMANVTTVSVSCVSVGRFVYVVNSSDNGGAGDVAAFSINPSSGALTSVAAPVPADASPSGIALDRTGQFAYVSNRATSDVTLFDVDSTTGALSFHKNFYSKNTGEAAIAVAPSNQYVYVGGFAGTPPGSGSVFGFSLGVNSGGDLSAVPGAPAAAGNPLSGVAIDPASQFVFATTGSKSSLYVYSIGTGGTLAQLLNSPFTTGSGPTGVVVYPLGTATLGYVYTADSAVNDVSAFSYDGTGNLTELTGSPYHTSGTQPEGIAIDSVGKFLYVTNYVDGTITTFSVNPQSGVLTKFGLPVPTGSVTGTNPNPGPVDVKVDPSNQFVYVVNKLDGSVSLFTVSAGALTLKTTYPTGTGATAVALALE